jgi:hypothetical protein
VAKFGSQSVSLSTNFARFAVLLISRSVKLWKSPTAQFPTGCRIFGDFYAAGRIDALNGWHNSCLMKAGRQIEPLGSVPVAKEIEWFD